MKIKFVKPITLSHIREYIGFSLFEISSKLNISEQELIEIENSETVDCFYGIKFQDIYGVDIVKILDTDRLLENTQICFFINRNLTNQKACDM